MNRKEKIICENCKNVLTDSEIKCGWRFGKIWFCRTTCAVGWSVKQHLEKGGKS